MAEEELRGVIQRCQILDEEEFKAEDFNLFQVAGQKCLDEGYVSEVLEVVENEKNREQIIVNILSITAYKIVAGKPRKSL